MTYTNWDEYRKDDGFMTVSKEAFFMIVGSQNVFPSNTFPEFTDWKTWKDGDFVVIGRSRPGWKNPGDKKVWMLKK